MLILTRGIGDSVVIDGDIVVTVVDIKQTGAVKLGITAPKSVPVYREEVYSRMRTENEIAENFTKGRFA